MATIEDAISISVNAHDGQKDMVGNPAINHVLVEVVWQKGRLLREFGAQLFVEVEGY